MQPDLDPKLSPANVETIEEDEDLEEDYIFEEDDEDDENY